MAKFEFIDINDLLSYYRYLKLNVENPIRCHISDIKKQVISDTPSPIIKIKSIEEKLAFICDVESIVKFTFNSQFSDKTITIIPLDALYEIFTRRVVKQQSYKQIAQFFNVAIKQKKYTYLPKRLSYSSNICNIFHVILKNADKCYVNKFYIENKVQIGKERLTL
ncbi:MAG: hypothetical protein L3V56_10860 [Candidatus Magnetoovum sp. WYHC-5]|nr:hypothetical protein [Candidatus Magnetoovum sp. WYHC-5]